jgi:hypothetical protein
MVIAIERYRRHTGQAAARILEDIFLAEVLRAQNTLFFRQEKSLQRH